MPVPLSCRYACVALVVVLGLTSGRSAQAATSFSSNDVPVVTWNPPAYIDLRTDPAATAAQNATSDVPGTFTYHWSGFIDNTLSPFDTDVCLWFAPSDSARYEQVFVCRSIALAITSESSAPRRVDFIPAPTPEHSVLRLLADPARDTLWVVYRQNPESVTVIDARTDAILRTVDLTLNGVTGRATALALDETTGRIFITDAAHSLLWTVDPGASQPSSVVPISESTAGPVAFGLGQNAVFNRTDRRLYVGAQLTGTSLQPVLLGIDPGNTAPQNVIAIPLFAQGVGSRHIVYCSGLASAPGTVILDETAGLVHAVDGRCGLAEIVDVNAARPATYHTVVGRLPVPAALVRPAFAWGGEGATAMAASRRFKRVYVAGVDWSDYSVWLQVYDGDPLSPTFTAPLAFIPLPSTLLSGVVGALGMVLAADSDLLYVASGDPQGNIDAAVLVGVDLTTDTVASISGLRTADAIAAMAYLPSRNRFYIGVGVGEGNGWGSGIAVFQEQPTVRSLATPLSSSPVLVDARAVQVTFAAVTATGLTTVERVPADAIVQTVPSRYEVLGKAYEISTTALVAAPIQLCFNVSEITDPATFATLSVLHGENGILVDRTTSRNFASGTICATVSSLSPFVIARPKTVNYTVRTLYSPTKAVKSGSTIPLKIHLLDPAGVNVSSGAVIVRAVAMTLKGGTAAVAIVDAGAANPNAIFRFDRDLAGYIYNLSTRGLAPGVYQLRLHAAGDPLTHTIEFSVDR